MIKRPYQKMSFQGSSGTRPGGFGKGKPWDRGGDSSDSRRRSFGGDRGYGGEREMHPATCNNCGASCEVPFVPNGSKPIYCRNCFKRDDAPSQHFGGDRERGSFHDRRPAFTDRMPKENGGASNSGVEQQLKAVHTKLDTILALLRDDTEAS